MAMRRSSTVVTESRQLGVYVLGELATEIVHIGMMAMLGGATVEIFGGVLQPPDGWGALQVGQLRRVVQGLPCWIAPFM